MNMLKCFGVKVTTVYWEPLSLRRISHIYRGEAVQSSIIGAKQS